MKNYTLSILLIISGLLLSFVIAPKVLFVEINENLTWYKKRQTDFETKIKTEVTDWLKEEDTKWISATKAISLDFEQLNQQAERQKNNFWLPSLYSYHNEVRAFGWQFSDRIRLYEDKINLKSVFIAEITENSTSEKAFLAAYESLKPSIVNNATLEQKNKDYILAELEKAQKAHQLWKSTIDKAQKLVSVDFKEKTDAQTVQNMRDELHQESVFPHNRMIELQLLHQDCTIPTTETEERYSNYIRAVSDINTDYLVVRGKVKPEFVPAFHKVDSLLLIVNKGTEEAVKLKAMPNYANTAIVLDKINMPFSLLDHEYAENKEGYFAFVSQDSLLNIQINDIDKMKFDKTDTSIIRNSRESANMRVLAKKHALSGKWFVANQNLYTAGVKSDYNYTKIYKTSTTPRQQNSVSHDNYYSAKKSDAKSWSSKSTSTPSASYGNTYSSHSTASHSYSSPSSKSSSSRSYSSGYSSGSSRSSSSSSSSYKSSSSSSSSSSSRSSASSSSSSSRRSDSRSWSSSSSRSSSRRK